MRSAEPRPLFWSFMVSATGAHPGEAVWWASLLPKARLLTIEEGAHVPWIEAPQQVFGAIDSFLNGGWPEGARSVKGTVLEPEGMESRHHSRQG